MACKAMKLPRSSYYYHPVIKEDGKYITQLNNLVEKHVSIGFLAKLSSNKKNWR
jgi:hypothetical protein